MSGSIPSWAVKGAKCRCVLVKPVGHTYDGPRIVVGQVYTIRDIVLGPATGIPSLAFAELRNSGGYGPYWHIDQFRPLMEQSEDAEIEAQIYHKKGLHQRTSRKSRADA